MTATRRLAAPPALLLLLLSWSLSCSASPLQNLGDEATTTDPPPAPPPTETSVIDVQEQIYIITGVFITFIILLLVVSLATAYVVIGMRQTIKALQSAGAGLAGSRKPGQGQRRPTKKQAPKQPQQRDNRAFAPDDDDDDDDDRWEGDDLQNRGFNQFPDHGRHEPARPGRQLSSPPPVSEPQGYDRFHQPLPDAHMPSDRARRDSNSRYGAGNLSRLPKGPAPQPGGYDSRYPDDRERRGRSPGRGQW